MRFSDNFKVMISTPFGMVSVEHGIMGPEDNPTITIGGSKLLLKSLYEYDMEHVSNVLNNGLKKGDRYYVDLDTVEIWKVHINGETLFISYFFDEAIGGQRLMAGAMAKLHNPYVDENIFYAHPMYFLQNVAW